MEGTEWPDSIPQGLLRERMWGVGKTGVERGESSFISETLFLAVSLVQGQS